MHRGWVPCKRPLQVDGSCCRCHTSLHRACAFPRCPLLGRSSEFSLLPFLPTAAPPRLPGWSRPLLIRAKTFCLLVLSLSVHK